MQLYKSLNLVIFLLVILSAGVARVQSTELQTGLQYHYQNSIVDKYCYSENFLTDPSYTTPHYVTPKTGGERRRKRAVLPTEEETNRYMGTLLKYIRENRIDEKTTIFSRLKEFKQKLSTIHLAGIGGSYEWVAALSSQKGQVTADHGPPYSVYRYSTSPEVRGIMGGDMGVVSLRESVHNELITTGGAVNEDYMKKTEIELRAIWSNRMNDQLERSTNFNSHMAKLFSENRLADALELQHEGAWELSMLEVLGNEIKASLQVLPDWEKTPLRNIVSAEKLEMLTLNGGLKGETTVGALTHGWFQIDGTKDSPSYINLEVRLRDFFLDGVTIDPPWVGEMRLVDIAKEIGTESALTTLKDPKLLIEFLQKKQQATFTAPSLITLETGFKQGTFTIQGTTLDIIPSHKLNLHIKDLLTPDALASIGNEKVLDLPLRTFLSLHYGGQVPPTWKLSSPLSSVMNGLHPLVSPIIDVIFKKTATTHLESQIFKEDGKKIAQFDNACKTLDVTLSLKIAEFQKTQQDVAHLCQSDTKFSDLLNDELRSQLVADKGDIGKMKVNEVIRDKRAYLGTGIRGDETMEQVFKFKDGNFGLNGLDWNLRTSASLHPKYNLASPDYRNSHLDFHAAIVPKYDKMFSGFIAALEKNVENFKEKGIFLNKSLVHTFKNTKIEAFNHRNLVRILPNIMAAASKTNAGNIKKLTLSDLESKLIAKFKSRNEGKMLGENEAALEVADILKDLKLIDEVELNTIKNTLIQDFNRRSLVHMLPEIMAAASKTSPEILTKLGLSAKSELEQFKDTLIEEVSSQGKIVTEITAADLQKGVEHLGKNWNLKRAELENFMNKILDKSNQCEEIKMEQKKLEVQYKTAYVACSGGSVSRRSVGRGKSCSCNCALRKPLPKKKKDERKVKRKKGKISAQLQLDDTLNLKKSIKSGDIVDELAGIRKRDDEAGKPSKNKINNNQKLVKAIDFKKLQVGKGSLRKALKSYNKLKKVGSSLKSNVIQRTHQVSKGVRKFGSKAYSRLDKVHKKMGKFNKAFLFRNLAKGIRARDVKSIGQTASLVGAGKLGLKKVGQTKGIWRFSQKFVENIGEVIGAGLDLVGIGFDIISIVNSVKCIERKSENEANCEMEQKYLNDGSNATVLIIILENPTCVDDVDICGGRNAILDIVGSSVSIGLSVVGMACPPCQPVTMVTDFVINRIVEVFQAGNEIAALNKVIPLTENEKASQWFRKLTFQGFSAYLTDLKEAKQLQTEVMKHMSSFLLRNEQFSAIVVPKKTQFKKRIHCERFRRQVIWLNYPSTSECKSEEPEDTFVDLTHQHSPSGPYHQARWSPDESKLPRKHSLFCPPLLKYQDKTAVVISEPESFCHDTFGLSSLKRGEGRRATVLHYNMFPPPRRSSGHDSAWGYTQSQNVFIFSNTNVEFHGGDEDDLFVVEGCCPTGFLYAGGGIDTLDLSSAVGEARSRAGVRIDLVGGKVHFNPMKSLSINGFEIIEGASNEVERIVVDCELTALSLGGGISELQSDEITIPSLPKCNTRDLTLELGNYTRVDNRGIGRFHWKIQSHTGIIIKTTSLNSTHTFELPFCYMEVTNISINNTLNLIKIGWDKILINWSKVLRMGIQIQLLDKIMETNDLFFFTQAKFHDGHFCPSARILGTPTTTLLPPLLLLISVNVNEPNSDKRIKTLTVRGHPHFLNIFNIIAHDEIRSKEVVVIGGGRNVFILNGLIRGVLQAGNESNTLDVSAAVPKNETFYLHFNLGVLLFSNNATVRLYGKFQEIIGREKAQDILTLGSHCYNQSTTNIDLRGGESAQSPDIITITSQQNQSSCNQHLTLHLWPHTRLVNRGKGNGDLFVYLVAKGIHDLTLSITETTNSTHAIQLQFTYTDIEEIIVGDPNTMTIGLKWGESISLQGSASGEHILKMNSARLVTEGGKVMDRRRRREAQATVNTVPQAKLILRGSEPVLEIYLTSENIQSPAAASDQLMPVFKGHSTISNLYFIHPQLHTQISAIWGGTGNDTFVPLSLNSTRLDFISNIASTLNTLDFTQMKDENDTTVVEVDLVHDRVTYTTGNETRQQVTRGFTYLFGRSNGREAVIGDSCRTEFIDLGGGGPIDWILIPESDTNCTGDAVNEMTIVVRGGTRVVIGSTTGAYKYDLSLDDEEVSENGLDFRVSCLKQDMSFGLCYGTTQTVRIEGTISDFTSIQVLQDQVSLQKTVQFTYEQETVLNFTLEYFNKSEAVTFPASWLSYLPIDSELEGGWFENPGAVSSDEDLDELLVTSLEYRQDTFSFQFQDGATLSINRMNKLTLVQNEPNCKSTAIKRIIEEKILLAFKFQATIVTICEDQALIILTGGDEEADSLENVPDYETHLVGNMGVESVFKIIPSNLTAYVHLSGTEDTRNILDLTAFYDPDVVISQSHFPSVIEDEDTKDLVLTLGSGQEVVFVQGAYQHEQLSVVLRYTELAFSTFLQITNETTRNKRAESIREWMLVQKNITFDEEKELVFLSADDFDTDSTIFQIPNGTSATNSVFRLENDSIVVTRMFGEEDPESQSQTIVILDSDRMVRGNSSEIKLIFGDSQGPATVVVVLNEEYVANLRSVQTEINIRLLIYIIAISLSIIFVPTLLILFYFVFKHKKRIFRARGGNRNTRKDEVVDCSDPNEMENLALQSFDITAQEVHYDCGDGTMGTRKHATFTFYEPLVANDR